MNANRYMKACLQTADRSDLERLRLECALGLCCEAGRLAKQMPQNFLYGHKPDKCYMIDKLGDMAWYLAVLCDAIGSDLDTVMEENMKKLEQMKQHYPDGFDGEKRIHRKEYEQHEVR